MHYIARITRVERKAKISYKSCYGREFEDYAESQVTYT